MLKKRLVGDTLIFRFLGNTSSHLRVNPGPFFGSPLPRKSTCLRNPSKTNEKSMVLASLGPAWGAPGGILGSPGGRLGAPRGLPKRCLEAPFVFGCALGGFWGHLGPSKKLQYPLGKTDFRARERLRKLQFWTVRWNPVLHDARSFVSITFFRVCSIIFVVFLKSIVLPQRN